MVKYLFFAPLPFEEARASSCCVKREGRKQLTDVEHALQQQTCQAGAVKSRCRQKGDVVEVQRRATWSLVVWKRVSMVPL